MAAENAVVEMQWVCNCLFGLFYAAFLLFPVFQLSRFAAELF